jgi:hypothetical protein
MRPADGIVEVWRRGPGANRGGINWNGVLYRVMGTKLVSVAQRRHGDGDRRRGLWHWPRDV